MIEGVCLYKVGRNLNRAYRTCEAFGVQRLQLYDCDARLSGNLFAAAGRVSLETVDAFPLDAVALETWGDTPLQEVGWRAVRWLVIGGETAGLPRKINMPVARIPLIGQVSGLTVEAALAIALYEAGRRT